MVSNIKEFLLEVLRKIDKIIHFNEILKIKANDITQKQTSIFAKIITINDLKQFYLAKLQGYLKDELEDGLQEKIDEMQSILLELHDAHFSLQKHLGLIKGFKKVSFFMII